MSLGGQEQIQFRRVRIWRFSPVAKSRLDALKLATGLQCGTHETSQRKRLAAFLGIEERCDPSEALL